MYNQDETLPSVTVCLARRGPFFELFASRATGDATNALCCDPTLLFIRGGARYLESSVGIRKTPLPSACTERLAVFAVHFVVSESVCSCVRPRLLIFMKKLRFFTTRRCGLVLRVVVHVYKGTWHRRLEILSDCRTAHVCAHTCLLTDVRGRSPSLSMSIRFSLFIHICSPCANFWACIHRFKTHAPRFTDPLMRSPLLLKIICATSQAPKKKTRFYTLVCVPSNKDVHIPAHLSIRACEEMS